MTEQEPVPDLFAPARPRELGFLFSFFYFRDTDMRTFIDALSYQPKVFVDSGGFTAFTKGATIDIDEYARWIHRNNDVIDVYVNLDEIGNPKETLRNQLRMEQLRLRPLPVIHFGAEPDEVARYAARGYDHQCLGGLVPHLKTVHAEVKSGSGPVLDWLDRMHEVAKERGVELHGFGATTWPLLKRYAWRSVDSSTWTAGFRFGRSTVFDHQRGRWLGLDLRDRQRIMGASQLLRRYGCDPLILIRDTEQMSTRHETIKLAVRSWLLATRWLHANQEGETTVFLADPNSGYRGRPDLSVASDALSGWS